MRNWGQRWIICGDFNDILGAGDQRSGRLRHESSFWHFQNFVREMQMVEVPFKDEGGLGQTIEWGNGS